MNEQIFQLDKYLFNLRERVRKLSINQQIAFALATCERLAPFYKLFGEKHSGYDTGLYRAHLDRLWAFVLGAEIGVEEVKKLRANLPLDDFDEDDEFLPYFDEMLEGVGALELTLDALTADSASNCVLASSKVINALLFRHIFENMETEFDPKQIENHPLTMKEKEFHHVILSFLEKRQPTTETELVQLHEIIKNPEYDLFSMLGYK